MFVDDLFDKKSLTEAQGGGSPWHSEPEQQQMDADRRGRLGRERNAGLDEPDDAASGPAQTGNGVYEYTVPAGQESTAQELGLQQHRGHWFSRVPIQRANFQFGQPQFREIPSQGVAEGSKEKTPGVALSKAYQKDFDGKKPVNRRPETALTGTYSKTGKPGGELKKRSVAEGDDIQYHQTSGTKAGHTISSRKLSNKPQASKSDVTLQSGSMHHSGESYDFPKGTLFTQLPGGIFAKHPSVPETHPGYGHLIRRSEDNIQQIHGALNGQQGVAEGQLNEYLVREGEPFSEVLNLNVFMDTSPDGQVGMNHDPQWRQLMAKYQPIAKQLKQQIRALNKYKLSPNEVDAIHSVWYDGSDAYDDMEVDYLAGLFDQQIKLVKRMITVRLRKQGVTEGDAPVDHDWYRKQQERQTRAKQKQQGMAEGVDDLKNIDPSELAGSTLGGIAGYMAGDALGGPMVGFGAAGVGSAIGGALAKEGMMSNPGQEDSPVSQAIIRRILLQRTDLLAKHGPEKVGQAVDEVADFVGDVDEIGSSDVSGWVRHVEQMLGNMEEDVAEGSMLNKIKAPAAPSSPALAAPRAPAVAETLRQIDRMLESVNSKKSAEIVKAYADQQFTKLGLHNTTECKQIMAHVVHESAVRRRAYAQRMAK
jgi:hypothetical protein